MRPSGSGCRCRCPRSRSAPARTAHDRPLGAHDVDADPAVSDPGHAGRIRADEVALDDIVVRGRPEHADRVLGVPRDDVAGPRDRAADRVPARAAVTKMPPCTSVFGSATLPVTLTPM